MSHTTAIRAFNKSNNTQSGPLLLQLYGALVTIELLVKDHLHISKCTWHCGHDICAMLLSVDPGMSSISIQLSKSLGQLYCTARDGSESTVSAQKYPDIRYLRHIDDLPAWPRSSDDNMLIAALNDARTCLQQLKNLTIIP